MIEMKKIALIIIAFLGVVVFLACEKELRDPQLDINQSSVPAYTNPTDGEAFIFLEENVDEVFAVFEWSPAQYNVTNMEDTKYTLQMDKSGNNFEEKYELANITETSYEMTVGEMNNVLLTLNNLPNTPVDYEFRIYSYVNNDSEFTDLYSGVITLTFTPFESLVVVNPIYLIGDATPAGWDNTAGTPMAHLGDGVYAVVETLDPAGEWYKFLSVPGQWAPQWGTDDAGSSAEGNLVYRPDEATDDPPAIPSPDVLGAYYVEADTVNLLYRSFLTSGELYLVGAATTVGWDNTAALPFTETSAGSHIFEITTTLTEGGMKFLEIVGEWAPQWGTNEIGTGNVGPLIYRPDEITADPAEVPSPGSGTFKITVDLTTLSYSIEPQ